MAKTKKQSDQLVRRCQPKRTENDQCILSNRAPLVSINSHCLVQKQAHQGKEKQERDVK